MTTSGYTNCACRDCFEIAVSNAMSDPDLCQECSEAGCERDESCECKRPETYDTGDEGDT